jgi:pyridinium-3,5-bisthiocarboxylic acid mononucleotide nickel chelatase
LKLLTVLYFDCFSGVSGDMILGALIDAGVRLEDVRRALGSLAITPDTVWTEPVVRAGIRATKFNVRGETGRIDNHHEHGHQHEHAHAHAATDSHGHESQSHQHASEDLHRPESDSHRHASEHLHRPESQSHRHASEDLHRHESQSHRHASEDLHRPESQSHQHRTLPEIFSLIDRFALSGAAKDRTKQLFTVLGEAEAAIHGTPLERVHLHEVGALDSIIDIAGTVFALEQLGVNRILSSPLNVGGGTIQSAHGNYPVPAPATMRLLKGTPVYSGGERVELVTPTGALLITGYANAFGPIPAMKVDRIGYGAGARDFPHSPNVLRVLLGELESTAPTQSVVVIEAEIDDMNPQIFGVLMDHLLAGGALDVFYTSIQMKKNRPGTLLTVIASPGDRDRLTATIFRETTTIGVRYREMSRECLDREIVNVQTALGPVRVKVARRGGEIVNVSPEFDDCLRLATEHGRPVKEIQALASLAYFSR